MKTAVLISGQMRTFAKCYPAQKWQIFRHYEPDIHFFVSCVDDQQAASSALLLRDYENVFVERYQDPTDLTVIPNEKGAWAPYANATTHDKLMLQHWGNKKVWDFFCASADTGSFDVIIRIRPDIWIHRFTKPLFKGLEPWLAEDANTAFCPWWGKFGGVNDRLAVLGKRAADAYFNTFDMIPTFLKLGCPFHPETLTAETMRGAHVSIRNLMAEFSTERMDGSRRWAEIVMSDLAELIASR